MFQGTEQLSDLVEVFLGYRKQLCHAAEKILGSPERAEDVVQDAYFKISAAKSIVTIKNPVGYVFRVVRNLAIDRYRHGQLESGIFLIEEGDGFSEERSLLGVPEQQMIDRQDIELIMNALNKLPDRTRKAFELYRFAGYTQRDIAEMLGVSPTLVNFMIRDALKQCHDALI